MKSKPFLSGDPCRPPGHFLVFFSGDSNRIIIFWAAIDPSAWTVVTSRNAASWEHTIRWAVATIFRRSSVLNLDDPPR